ncbi:MAG: ATP-dependent RNA helicase [Treponema sp.]|nr:ATP-dependent RNA helicase [Treponema sp.]
MNYTELPVYQHKELILAALQSSQVVVVESPTGSGKTTQLPVILDAAGYGKNGIIGVTQPRRIAAVSVSEFIARQMGTVIPGPVGYKMRFEDKTNPGTRIKIMTDGILLQEMKLDPWLTKYGCLIIDEAHERSLNIDFILGLLKQVLDARKEFKLIVSSATINTAVFSQYFGQCPIVKIEASSYPVTLVYDPPLAEMSSSQALEEALLNKIAAITERIISEKQENKTGDILIFLPGEKIIKECMERLVMGNTGVFLHVIPLYGRLGKEEQERVFEESPPGKTKVVIATNIAETSITIDGITAVIDSGLSKLNYYNPKTFTSSLVETPVSKASANQRKGRAGRTREGICYRLYSRKDFENRRLFTAEEIYRTDLSEVVLRMAELGITEFENFDFISPPGREGIIAAIETLNLLDALQADRTLSKTGQLMTEFPLLPQHSRIIAEAILKYPDVVHETAIAAAFLSTQSPYILPPGEEMEARQAHHSFRDRDGDFVSYLKLLKAYSDSTAKQKFCAKNYLDERVMAEIENVVLQLEQILSDLKIPVLSGGSTEDYLCAVGKGLIQFICVREGEMYRSLTADRIMIHPGSVMFKTGRDTRQSNYIVAGEIVRTSRMYAMSVSPLSESALMKISPEILQSLSGGYGYGPGSGFKSEEKSRKGKSKKTTESKLKKLRDFTNSIKIGNEIFEIQNIKGKKEVILPWERLKMIKDQIQADTVILYKGLKGTIVVNEKYTLLKNEKLSLILTLLPNINPEEAIHKKIPAGIELDSNENLDNLLEQLPDLVTPALWKKKSKTGSRELGFTGLFTDGSGNYRIKCCKDFHTSLNESIASLESLIDELGEEIDIGKKHIVNQCYRRLSDLLG